MEIKKVKSQFGPDDILVTSGDLKYQLFFGGDGELYW